MLAKKSLHRASLFEIKIEKKARKRKASFFNAQDELDWMESQRNKGVSMKVTSSIEQDYGTIHDENEGLIHGSGSVIDITPPIKSEEDWSPMSIEHDWGF